MSTKKLILYGEARELFGEEFTFEARNLQEVFHAMKMQVKGFREYLRAHIEDPFQILVGETPKGAGSFDEPIGSMEVIKLVPVVSGSKDGGLQILGGIILMAASPFMGPFAPYAFNIGLAMTLGGVASMLAVTPTEPFKPTSSSEVKTFGFGRPTMTTGQGGYIPMGNGRFRIAGHVISAGISTQAWQARGFGGLAPDDNGTTGGNGDTIPWCASIAPKTTA